MKKIALQNNLSFLLNGEVIWQASDSSLTKDLPTYILKMDRGGGLGVNVFAIKSNDPSSNLPEVIMKNCVGKCKIFFIHAFIPAFVLSVCGNEKLTIKNYCLLW